MQFGNGFELKLRDPVHIGLFYADYPRSGQVFSHEHEERGSIDGGLLFLVGQHYTAVFRGSGNKQAV